MFEFTIIMRVKMADDFLFCLFGFGSLYVLVTKPSMEGVQVDFTSAMIIGVYNTILNCLLLFCIQYMVCFCL